MPLIQLYLYYYYYYYCHIARWCHKPVAYVTNKLMMGHLWCCIFRITLEDVRFVKSVRPSLCPCVAGQLTVDGFP